MTNFFLVNTILDRLPMSVFGITYKNSDIIGQVCLKLNIVLKRSKFSLP